MTTILSATSRGQITLPKNWRDQFDTAYYEAEIQGDSIVIKPLKRQKGLENELEEAWQEYQKGNFIAHEDLIKEYGL